MAALPVGGRYVGKRFVAAVTPPDRVSPLVWGELGGRPSTVSMSRACAVVRSDLLLTPHGYSHIQATTVSRLCPIEANSLMRRH